MTATKSFPSKICLLNIITIFERCHIAILLTFLGKNIFSKQIFKATSVSYESSDCSTENQAATNKDNVWPQRPAELISW